MAQENRTTEFAAVPWGSVKVVHLGELSEPKAQENLLGELEQAWGTQDNESA